MANNFEEGQSSQRAVIPVMVMMMMMMNIGRNMGELVHVM
jgi:hypothetical protein